MIIIKIGSKKIIIAFREPRRVDVEKVLPVEQRLLRGFVECTNECERPQHEEYPRGDDEGPGDVEVGGRQEVIMLLVKGQVKLDEGHQRKDCSTKRSPHKPPVTSALSTLIEVRKKGSGDKEIRHINAYNLTFIDVFVQGSEK